MSAGTGLSPNDSALTVGLGRQHLDAVFAAAGDFGKYQTVTLGR